MITVFILFVFVVFGYQVTTRPFNIYDFVSPSRFDFFHFLKGLRDRSNNDRDNFYILSLSFRIHSQFGKGFPLCLYRNEIWSPLTWIGRTCFWFIQILFDTKPNSCSLHSYQRNAVSTLSFLSAFTLFSISSSSKLLRSKF